jgi:hypothetical protein
VYPPCNAEMKTWQSSAQRAYSEATVACSATVPSTPHNGTASVNNSFYPDLLRGSASFRCAYGEAFFLEGGTCGPVKKPEIAITARNSSSVLKIVEPGTPATIKMEPNMHTGCKLRGGAWQNNDRVSVLPLRGGVPYITYLDASILARTTYTLTCDEGSASSTVEIIPTGFES